MRVVMLRTGIPVGDSRLLKTAEAIKDSGQDIVLLGWDRGASYKTKSGVCCYKDNQYKTVTIGIKAERAVGFKKLWFNMFLYHIKTILWLIKNRTAYDTIHANDLDTGVCALFMCVMYKKKYVYDIYDFYADSRDYPFVFDKAVRYLEHSVIRKAKTTIICSEERTEQIRGATPMDLCVVYNTPDIELLPFKRPNILKSNKHNIVFIGNFAEGRFIEEMIDVISSRNDYTLHIGGYGHPRIEQTINYYSQIHNNIVSYGRLEYTDVIALESDCDIMIALYDPAIPNHKYAAPNKFFESLMLGKPIIMAKGTGFSDVVEKEGLGVVIEYSKDGLNKGLDMIKEMDFEDIAKRGKNAYLEKYSWEEMRKRIRKIYEDI